MKKILPKNQYLRKFSTYLRNNSTYTEIQLWFYLSNKQLGYTFKRQVIIKNFILDFYAPKLKLAIEIDGISHGGNKEYDDYRQKILENMGISFLRFSDYEIVHELPLVMKTIETWIKNKKT